MIPQILNVFNQRLFIWTWKLRQQVIGLEITNMFERNYNYILTADISLLPEEKMKVGILLILYLAAKSGNSSVSIL